MLKFALFSSCKTLSLPLFFSTFLQSCFCLCLAHSRSHLQRQSLHVFVNAATFPIYFTRYVLSFSTSFSCFLHPWCVFCMVFGAISFAILLYLLAHSLFVSFWVFQSVRIRQFCNKFSAHFCSHSLGISLARLSPLSTFLSRFRFRALQHLLIKHLDSINSLTSGYQIERLRIFAILRWNSHSAHPIEQRKAKKKYWIKEQLYTTFTGNELFCYCVEWWFTFHVPLTSFQALAELFHTNPILTIANEIKISFVGSQMIFTSHLWWSPSI